MGGGLARAAIAAGNAKKHPPPQPVEWGGAGKTAGSAFEQALPAPY